MHIRQITSSIVCGLERIGKWYCSDSAQGSDGDLVVRYLRKDGTWGRTTEYFDSEEQLQEAISKGKGPDFSISKDEALSRRMIQDWYCSEEGYQGEQEDLRYNEPQNYEEY